jgi:hypothetical protein
MHGRITLTAVDAAWSAAHRHDPAAMAAPPPAAVRDRGEGDNVTCTNGLTAIAAALVWAGIQDQAANLGVTTPTYLTPLWGAVGNGAGTPSASDTALFAEIARQTAGAGASSPATPSIDGVATWLFYFPSPPVVWNLTEAGVFANGTSAAGSGTLVDHYAFSVPVTVTTTDSLILQVAFSVAGS